MMSSSVAAAQDGSSSVWIWSNQMLAGATQYLLHSKMCPHEVYYKILWDVVELSIMRLDCLFT